MSYTGHPNPPAVSGSAGDTIEATLEGPEETVVYNAAIASGLKAEVEAAISVRLPSDVSPTGPMARWSGHSEHFFLAGGKVDDADGASYLQRGGYAIVVRGSGSGPYAIEVAVVGAAGAVVSGNIIVRTYPFTE